MAELNIDSLKSLLHHLLDRNPVDESVHKDLHAQVDNLDAEPKPDEPEEELPPGFVKNADGTYSKTT